MLIMTQWGNEVVNFNRMERVFTEIACAAGDGSCKVAALGESGKYTTLGWYRNKERAKDIILEIVRC